MSSAPTGVRTARAVTLATPDRGMPSAHDRPVSAVWRAMAYNEAPRTRRVAYKKSKELPDMSGILEDSQAARGALHRAERRSNLARSVRAALARLGLRARR